MIPRAKDSRLTRASMKKPRPPAPRRGGPAGKLSRESIVAAVAPYRFVNEGRKPCAYYMAIVRKR
jgi:hypothetical protein